MTIFDDPQALITAQQADAESSDGELTWPEREEHYRRVIGRSAFLDYEDGWAYGMWFWAIAGR
jgi:hypothetical protein